MATYNIAEAKDRLPELINRALKGEDAVITWHDLPVVELKPIPPAPRAERTITAADLDWLAARRVGLKAPAEDAGTLVSRMRDESER